MARPRTIKLQERVETFWQMLDFLLNVAKNFLICNLFRLLFCLLGCIFFSLVIDFLLEVFFLFNYLHVEFVVLVMTLLTRDVLFFAVRRELPQIVDVLVVREQLFISQVLVRAAHVLQVFAKSERLVWRD